MTPEQKIKMRQMYADNLIELMALQPELFETKPTAGDIKESAKPSVAPKSKDGDS